MTILEPSLERPARSLPLAAARRWLAPLVARFCERRPKVRLTFEVGGTQTVSERVAAGELDAGLCSPPSTRLGLHFEPLYVEPMAVLLRETDPLASAAVIDAADLASARLLLTEVGCAYREVIEQALTARGADVRVGVEISSGAMLVRTVQAGLGVAVLPRAYADPTPPGTVFRNVRGLDLALTVGLVQRGDDAPGRALTAFLDDVRAASPGAAARGATPFEETEGALHESSLDRTAAVS